jgi:hypothetical protein
MKPENNTENTAGSGSSTPTCSPTLRMIRLVIQLVDTPGNRAAMDAIHGYAKKKKLQGPHGALKRENVQVIELQTTRPRKSPNAKDVAAAGKDAKPHQNLKTQNKL